MKPYYEEPGIVIYRGDCLEIMPTIKGVQLLLTDPPYGINFDTDYRRFTLGFDVPRTNHISVKNDDKPFDPIPFLGFKTVILWVMNCFSSRLPLGSLLVWDKRFPNGKAFLADGEVAWMNRGHGVYIWSETSQGFVRKEPTQHPTQKPEGIMKWCIQKANTEGLILDPFMGSGTTLRAAKDLGRKAIGIEIEEKYCEIAVQRLRQEVLF